MFQSKRDFESDYRAARDVERSRELNPSLHSFAAWREAHRDRIVISPRA